MADYAAERERLGEEAVGGGESGEGKTGRVFWVLSAPGGWSSNSGAAPIMSPCVAILRSNTHMMVRVCRRPITEKLAILLVV